MRQPNYHSHWREWMHSRHWIMNAQFQGIHSLNGCCWVLCRHVGFFICLGTNLLYNCWDNIITLKYLQSCEKLSSKYKIYLCKCLILLLLFTLNSGQAAGGGCVVESADSSLDCYAWLLCPIYIWFWYSIWHCKCGHGASHKISNFEEHRF